MKPRILVLNGTCLDVWDDLRTWADSLQVQVVADPGLRKIEPEQVETVIAGTHGLIGPSAAPILPRHMERAPSLQVISYAASGYESVDVEAATRNGIVVTNAPVQEGIEVVADHTWALMLALARQVPHHNRVLADGRYERGMGVAVFGKTLGIVGLGHIGKAVARRTAGFDMRVLAAEITPDMDFVRDHNIELAALDDLLKRSDFVSLHLRINDETRQIIDKRALGLMKSTACLINTARAELVDEAALATAITAGRIAGAAVDDPPSRQDSPLLALPNFVCTPHLGNRAVEGVHAVTRQAVRNAVDVLEGRRPEYVVNPTVYDGPLRAKRPAE